jgi:PPOX class probable F420-dependent enzyme
LVGAVGEASPTPSRRLSGKAIFTDPLVRELLDARLIAVFATLEPDGSVHAVPMWYADDDAAVILATGTQSRKIRNLQRDARATVVLHDSRPGFEVCGASLRGRVTLARGDAAIELVSLVHHRYVTERGRRLPAVAEFLDSDDVALRFVPDEAITWDERGGAAAAALRDTGTALPLEPTTPRP